MQSQRQIGIFGQRFKTEATGGVYGRFSNRADRAGNDCHAIPTRIGAAIEIESAGVFQCLTFCDEGPQIPHFRMTRNRAHVLIRERLNETPERIALAMGIRIEEDDDPGTDRGQTLLERACLPPVFLAQ